MEPSVSEDRQPSTGGPLVIHRTIDGYEVEYVWRECKGCGKEYQYRHRLGLLPLDVIAPYCTVCERDLGIKMDLCPEVVIGEGSSSGCRLKYRHTGRCEPWTLDPEMMEHIRAAKARANGS